jgi:hypothetical protein
MVWERKCGNPKNKYKNCTYANCPEYLGADGGYGFDKYRLKCSFVSVGEGKSHE